MQTDIISAITFLVPAAAGQFGLFGGGSMIVVDYANNLILYWPPQINGGVPPTTAALQTVTAQQGANAQSASLQAQSVAKFLSTGDNLAIVLRALGLATVDAINAIRARLTAQDALIATSALPTAFKTAWAALTSMPQLTDAQAKNAVESRINSPTSL
jgi:hypothetical protein